MTSWAPLSVELLRALTGKGCPPLLEANSCGAGLPN